MRSIEQQYWSLAQQHVQLWSSEKAVELAREIVNREQAELVVGKEQSPTSRKPSSGSNSSTSTW